MRLEGILRAMSSYSYEGLTDEKEDDDCPYGMTIDGMVVDDRRRHSLETVFEGHPPEESGRQVSNVEPIDYFWDERIRARMTLVIIATHASSEIHPLHKISLVEREQAETP